MKHFLYIYILHILYVEAWARINIKGFDFIYN